MPEEEIFNKLFSYWQNSISREDIEDMYAGALSDMRDAVTIEELRFYQGAITAFDLVFDFMEYKNRRGLKGE